MSELSELWEHQKTGIARALPRSSFAFFMETGTGKTRTLLEVLRHHFRREGNILHTLVLCPAIVVQNWPAEIAKYTKFSDKQVIPLVGPGPRRLKDLAAARMRHPKGFIAITNYEALVSVRGMFEALMDWAPEIIVFDESQRIKTHDSKRTKAAHKLAQTARYRYLLSGTPILNSPMDAWAQYKAMDRGETFGDSYWIFRARYFYDKNAGMPKDKHFPEWVLRPGALEEFNRLISETSLVVKKSECLDLPPLVKQVIPIELSPEQRKHYNQMKDDYITSLGDSACTAQLAITKALRLQQIVAGHMPLDDDHKTVISFKDTPREKALSEILEDILEDPEHKVLIWACWRHDYEVIRRVCRELKQEMVEIHGEITPLGKQRAIDHFRQDSNCRVLLGHPGSGGIGINLVEASYAIYYSRNFNLEQDLQSEARNYRAGSERHASITRIDLVAMSTIDEQVQQALAKKVAIGDTLLRSIKNKL